MVNVANIDLGIVLIFLLITLVVGLRAGRGVKDIRAYAVADKQFGTVALTLTYLATNIAGASIFNITGIIFEQGIIITAALLALVLTFLSIALFIAPHAAKFTDCHHDGRLGGALLWPYEQAHRRMPGAFDYVLHCHHGVEHIG